MSPTKIAQMVPLPQTRGPPELQIKIILNDIWNTGSPPLIKVDARALDKKYIYTAFSWTTGPNSK